MTNDTAHAVALEALTAGQLGEVLPQLARDGLVSTEQVWRCHRTAYAVVYRRLGAYYLWIAAYRGGSGRVPATAVRLPSRLAFAGVTRCGRCGAGWTFWQVGADLVHVPTQPPTFATVVDGSGE